MSSTKHLIVDGANIVHAWPELRDLAKRDPSSARAKLWQMLIPLHDLADVRLTLVFDGRGEKMVIERPMQQATFSLVYTPSALTADDVIEQLVAHSSTPSECCVATDDNAERETVAALGAATMRSSELMEWLRRVEARQTAAVQDIKKANTRAWKQP